MQSNEASIARSLKFVQLVPCRKREVRLTSKDAEHNMRQACGVHLRDACASLQTMYG